MPPDLRDEVVDFVRGFSARTALGVRTVLAGLALAPTQFYRWADRYGRVNTHNGQVPRDHWPRRPPKLPHPWPPHSPTLG